MGAPEALFVAACAVFAGVLAGVLFLVGRGIFRWAADRVERDVSAGLRYGPSPDDDDFWSRP